MKKIFLQILIIIGFSPLSFAEKAIFSGGCFWCSESDFEKLDGVIEVKSGYTGGFVKNPSYEQVSRTETGHFEAVEVEYNEAKISYSQLLEHYWLSVDPFDNDGQFCDKGTTYKTAIFPLNESQKKLAEISKSNLQQKIGKDNAIVTRIINATEFYDAEKYHQDYYKNNPVRYKYYRWNCGRDQRLKEIWGTQVELPKHDS